MWGWLCEGMLLLVLVELWMQWNWIYKWHAMHCRLVASGRPANQMKTDSAETDEGLGVARQAVLRVLYTPCVVGFGYIYYLLVDDHVMAMLGTPRPYTVDSGLFCPK